MKTGGKSSGACKASEHMLQIYHKSVERGGRRVKLVRGELGVTSNA